MRARNGLGDGKYSDILEINTDDVPKQATNLVEVSVAPKTIVVQWDEFTLDADTGRDPIIYYKLEYKSNLPSSTWEELTSAANTPVITFTHTLPDPFPANID